MAALATVFVLAAYFPYITYAAPAVAGCVVMIVLIEINGRWAYGTYAVSSVLVLLMAEKEAGFMYIFFFGFYPIVKAWLERVPSRILEWVLKLSVFNAAVLEVYDLMAHITDLSIEDFDILGKYGAFIFLALGNIVFVLYDFALLRVATVYLHRVHPRVERIFHK